MENTSDYKYDVFISYSRKDYVDENKNVIPDNIVSQIKSALDEKGITYWMDEKGIYSGDEFAAVITGYIRLCKVFLFISTKNSNSSEWTSGEIATARMYKKKIIPFRYDDSFYNDGVMLYLAQLDHIDYEANPDQALNKLLDSIKKRLDDLEKEKKREEELILKRKHEEERKKKAEEEAKRVKIKAKIKELIEDYQRLSTQQETIQSELFEQSRLLGLDVKTCPVCGKSSKIDNLYCDRCGWTFHPLFAVDESYSQPNHKVLFSIFKTQWMSNEKIGEVRKKLDELTPENEQLKEQLKETQEKLDEERKASTEKDSKVLLFRDKAAALQGKLEVLTSENEQLKITLGNAEHSLEECMKSAESKRYYQIKAEQIESEKKVLEQQIKTLKTELSEQTILCRQSEQKLEQIENDFQKSQERIKELEDNMSSTELYDVILASPGGQKLEVVKMTRELTDLGLKESKELVDAAPSTILTNIESTTAVKIRQIFQNVGANVELRKSTRRPHNRIDDFLEYYSSYVPQPSQYKPNTLYDIILVSSGHQKLAVVKLVKDLTHLGLKESKEIVDAAPSTILKHLSITQAIEIADQFQNCEAKVELSPSE